NQIIHEIKKVLYVRAGIQITLVIEKIIINSHIYIYIYIIINVIINLYIFSIFYTNKQSSYSKIITTSLHYLK
ncbi:MAG: hypothetical protein N7Q72_05695, partial [Spiroplasma sp. Tabriz.8]|nr:hypothetical protein [Spiroplasma sp. Tabriz.8]